MQRSLMACVLMQLTNVIWYPVLYIPSSSNKECRIIVLFKFPLKVPVKNTLLDIHCVKLNSQRGHRIIFKYAPVAY